MVVSFKPYLINIINTPPPPAARVGLMVASMGVYAIAFMWLYPLLGQIPFWLYLLPVLVAAWCGGGVLAVATGLFAPMLHMPLLLANGHQPGVLIRWEYIPSIIASCVMAGIIGYLFDLHRRLHAELNQSVMLRRAERESHDFSGALYSLSYVLNETLDHEHLLDQVLDAVTRVAPYDGAQVLLRRDDTMQVIRQQGICPVDTLRLAQLQFEGQQQSKTRIISGAQLQPYTDTPSEMHSVMLAPVVGGGDIIGYLALYTHNADYMAVHAERMDMIANHVCATLRNAELYRALESAVVELNTLYQATAFLLPVDTMQQTAQQIAQAVALYFEHADCGVMLCNPDENQITMYARAGSYVSDRVMTLDAVGTSAIAESARQGTLVYVPDMAQDTQYARVCAPVGSELVIPLVGSGILGVLHLHSPQVNAFSLRDQRILMAFADRAAIAIDNMQLHIILRDFALDRETQVIERTAELNRAKERVEIILNSSSDMIILTLPDGRIEQSNRAFYSSFKYEVDEEFDWPLPRLVDEGSQQPLEQALKNVREIKRPQRLEVVAVGKDGSRFDADLVLSPILERSGECEGIVCSLRDISERKRLEQELRTALAKERELLELKTRFVSMASHEFRTPLATILATSNLLSNYLDRMDEAKKQYQFQKIQDQIQYMTALMDDVLSISRMEAGRTPIQYEAIVLSEFIDDFVEEFEQTQPDHPLDIQSEGQPYAMMLDPKLLRNIINNLLSNAAKYSPAGRSVHLHLRYEPDGVVFSVQDEGIGIPENDQPRLFEAFHRADNVGTTPGTGLGLAIVKNAVELHGGQISFVSKQNAGTTFTVYLPKEQVMERRIVS